MFSFNKNKPTDDFLSKIFEHQGIIHKVCNLYADSAEDRKDLFQDMLLQLWKSYASFQQNSKWSTWMYSVCLNTALNTLRKNKKSKSFFPLDFLKQEPAACAHEPSETDEQMVILHQAIATLSEIEKAIILLYLEEKSYEEIATIVGITTSNVGVKISRIKSKLELKLKSNHLNTI